MQHTFKAVMLSTALCLFLAAEAQAQATPAISSNWGELKGSQEDCTGRARSAMRGNSFRRVELIGQTTFGDRTSYQIGIRCIADRKVFYIFGGGPQEKTLRRYIDELKDEMDR